VDDIDQYLLKTIFLVHGKGDNLSYHFLYGYSIPIPPNNYVNPISEAVPLLDKNDDLNLSLYIEEKSLSEEELNQLHQYLEEGNCANPITKKDAQSSFNLRPAIYQFDHNTLIEEHHFQHDYLPPESISPFLSIVKSFIQSNKEERLLALLGQFSKCDQDLNNLLYSMLSALKKLTGLNFLQNSAGRLFNFESFEFPLGNIYKNPDIRIEVKKEELDNKSFSGKAIMIEKKGNLQNTKHIAHIRLLNNDEVILQQIVHLEENLTTVTANEDISAIEVSIFTEDGSKLLYTEKVGLLREIHLGMHLISGSVVIKDKFSSRVNDPELKTINQHSRDLPSRIGGHKTDPWVPESQKVKNFVRNRISKPKDSIWFPKGIENEGKTVRFLRELIDNSDNEKVFLVDPFFGKAAVSRLLFRLQNGVIDCEILTSFSNIDPDSANSKSNSKILDELKVFCSDYQLLLPSGIAIRNLKRGQSGNEQAFHDRYLCLKKKDGDIIIYLLSNSLNAAAAKYPFCISKLDIGASREIYYYIRSLSEGNDPSDSNVKLSVEEVWNPTVNSGRATESKEEENWTFYFSHHNQFLSWLFNDAKSSRDDLIEKAVDAGYVTKTDYGFNWENKSENFIEKIIIVLKERTPSNEAEWAGLVSGIARLIDDSHIKGNLRKQIDQLLLVHLKMDSGLIGKILDKIYIEERERKRFRETRYQRNTIAIGGLFRKNKEQNSYQVFDSLKNFFEYYSCYETPNCYELQYLFKLVFQIDPQLIYGWFSAKEDETIEDISSFEPFVYVQLFNYAFKQLTEQKEFNDSVDLFLNSPYLVLQMLSAAFLTFWKGWLHDDVFLFSVDNIVEFLKKANFDTESILWILCTRIPDLRIDMNRKQARPDQKLTPEELEQNLENYLIDIANKWPFNTLSEEAFKNASNSFHFRSEDAYTIAKTVEKRDGGKGCSSSKQLFAYCENIVDKWLHVINQNSEPHFYGPQDYDDIITAAKAFVELRRENPQGLTKDFRNRFGSNISSAVQRLSVPFAKSHDYKQWTNDVLVSGVGCYFMLQVLVASYENSLVKDGSSTPYVQMTKALLDFSSKLFLSEQGSWHDMYGLMDKLANELAWFTNFVFPEETASSIDTIINNEHFPLYKRAVFAIKAERNYRKDNKIPRNFLNKLLEEDCSEHADSRFFHCLDYCIGNTGKYCMEGLSETKKTVSLGLKKYSKILDKWKEFFGTLSFEAFENEDAKNRILIDSEFATTYCGYVLTKSNQ
jgi:hypothetical protein